MRVTLAEGRYPLAIHYVLFPPCPLQRSAVATATGRQLRRCRAGVASVDMRSIDPIAWRNHMYVVSARMVVRRSSAVLKEDARAATISSAVVKCSSRPL